MKALSENSHRLNPFHFLFKCSECNLITITVKRYEWLSSVQRLCLQRAGLCRGERVKNTQLKWGRVQTSDLLKYSWGFLHFKLLLLKRWLCFPVWQPLRKEELLLPCRVQLSRTKREWKPLRPPGLFIIDKCCTPASRIHSHRLLFLQFLISFLSLPGKNLEAQASCWNGVRRWALFELGNALSFGGFVFYKF